MMRLVAFKKAILAGALGALAWEGVIALLKAAGLPLFDMVRMLGGMAGGHGHGWLWLPFGILAHAMTGAIWAIFYAYFFWSTFDVRPVWQGMIFAIGPALLAGFIMLPQMGLMYPDAPNPGIFAWQTGWGGPAAIITGHAVYGAVMGALYKRPVGHRVHMVAVHG